ncbi:MAG: hypothetical protein NTV40_01105 [Solirubrobacterales bacterium]|nr:hypothetical protein [Solirubrobacterales bacterium]
MNNILLRTQPLQPIKFVLPIAVLLTFVALVFATVAPPAHAATATCANVIHSGTGPNGEGYGIADHITATGLSCRTARGVVRYFGCYQRGPYGWVTTAAPRGDSYQLRNGNWRIRFSIAGGAFCPSGGVTG